MIILILIDYIHLLDKNNTEGNQILQQLQKQINKIEEKLYGMILNQEIINKNNQKVNNGKKRGLIIFLKKYNKGLMMKVN